MLSDAVWQIHADAPRPVSRPARARDLTGHRFGKLTALYYCGLSGREAKWVCICDCGGYAATRLGNLRKGHTRSCGCLVDDMKHETESRQRTRMIGRKFNQLTVIDRDGTNGHGKPMWLCRCDCGNTTVVNDCSLKTGSTKSCGCLHRPDLTGLSFGDLVVRRRAGSRNGCASWECVCACGNLTQVGTGALRSGRTKSCGCLKRAIRAATPAHVPRITANQADIVAHKPVKTKVRPTGRVVLSPEQRIDRRRAHVRRRMAERYADPMIRMHMLIAGRLRKALRSIGERKTARTFEMLGYDAMALKCHLERQFADGMSWENMGEWHIDHIVPISSAKTQDDIIRLNQLPNLRPLWAKDNLSKSHKREFLL